MPRVLGSVPCDEKQTSLWRHLVQHTLGPSSLSFCPLLMSHPHVGPDAAHLQQMQLPAYNLAAPLHSKKHFQYLLSLGRLAPLPEDHPDALV